MQPIEFWKMQGSGNDFMLIDNRDGQVAEAEMGRLVERVCRRRESVGADGVIFVIPSKKHDFRWRFYNADGNEAEMCGNGGRCVARFAHLKGIAGPRMTFETLAGAVEAAVHGRRVKVRMPQPEGLKLNVALELQAGWEAVDFINTGVPHVVVSVADLDAVPVIEQGRSLRYHEMFAPQGTNADFLEVTGPDQVRMRTYERGVEDETLACGTGAIAACLVAAARGLVNSPVQVETRGGEVLTVHFQGPDGKEAVWLEGNTSIIYQGTLHREAL